MTYIYIYRITAVLKVETDINTSIAIASSLFRTSCDTNDHVETFKTDVIVGIGNVITGLTSQSLINFRISPLILIRFILSEIKS